MPAPHCTISNWPELISGWDDQNGQKSHQSQRPRLVRLPSKTLRDRRHAVSAAKCRYCCKSPKTPGDDFFERNEAELCSPINMAPRPLAKSPVSSSRGDEVPYIFIRESHQWARRILMSSGKGLLQQNLPLADVSRCSKRRGYSITSSALANSASGTL